MPRAGGRGPQSQAGPSSWVSAGPGRAKVKLQQVAREREAEAQARPLPAAAPTRCGMCAAAK